MKIRYSFIVLILILLFSACSPSPQVVAVNPDINLDELPAVIDAHKLSEIIELDGVFTLDVREQYEYDDGHIPGVVHIPMMDVPDRLNDIPRDETIVVTCRSGNRSASVVALLQAEGYENVINLAGGFNGWQSAGYPVEK